MVAVSGSVTRLVMKEAPIVEGGAVEERGRWGLIKRETREVLPTPWAPRTTIFASREFGGCGVAMLTCKVRIVELGCKLQEQKVEGQLFVIAFQQGSCVGCLQCLA